jgi:hypothetical protein
MGRFASRLAFSVVMTGILAGAQTIVDPIDRAKFNNVFDNAKTDLLHCNSRSFGPFIDFGFRFQWGYVLGCDVRQFGGLDGTINVLLRVRGEDGKETILGDLLGFRGFPKDAKVVPDLKKIHADYQFSGVLAAGAGVYSVQLLAYDNKGRIFRSHWKVKASPHGKENQLDFAVAPNTVVPLRPAPIPEKTSASESTPITVLLNAAPIFPWARKLRAWDRAFLLDSLSTVLRQLPYSSVRVVAFNLEQQQEIFRQNDFRQADMGKLSKALQELELGTIAYSVLERRMGWADLLLGLLRDEVQTKPSSKAVVFLGPMLRMEEKIPREALASLSEDPPPVFCVAYYPRMGADFPDSLQHLTSALKGKVFRIHSPEDLAQNLLKLKQEITVRR